MTTRRPTAIISNAAELLSVCLEDDEAEELRSVIPVFDALVEAVEHYAEMFKPGSGDSEWVAFGNVARAAIAAAKGE